MGHGYSNVLIYQRETSYAWIILYVSEAFGDHLGELGTWWSSWGEEKKGVEGLEYPNLHLMCGYWWLAKPWKPWKHQSRWNIDFNRCQKYWFSHLGIPQYVSLPDGLSLRWVTPARRLSQGTPMLTSAMQSLWGNLGHRQAVANTWR